MPADWHLLRTPPASGAYNMAVDAALLGDAAARGTGVWRCYDWALPTISFGRNEAVRTRFDDASVAAAGFDVVRRPTGGRALLHMAEVTYSVRMPLARSRPWQAAYALINEVLLSAVQSLGVDAELVTEHARVMPPDGPVCFAAPSLGEIAVHGAKLAGSAVLEVGTPIPPDGTPRQFCGIGVPTSSTAASCWPIGRRAFAMPHVGTPRHRRAPQTRTRPCHPPRHSGICCHHHHRGQTSPRRSNRRLHAP